MDLKEKKLRLHDRFIAICKVEIDRQKLISSGITTAEILSDNEKNYNILGKIPIVGSFINVLSLIDIVIWGGQKELFAKKVSRIFAAQSDFEIIKLLSSYIIPVINSISRNLDELEDVLEIYKIAASAYKKLFDGLKSADFKEEKLTSDIMESIREVTTNGTSEIQGIKKRRLDDQTSDADDFAAESEYFRIIKIEQNNGHLLSDSNKQCFYNAKASTISFICREAELAATHKYFLENENAIQVISGLGGIGKTQLALQYIHSYKVEYDNRVRFISAETQESLDSEFKEFAKDLGILIPNADPEEIKKSVKKVLENSIAHSLLVFDNVVSFNLIKDYLPSSAAISKHHIIITVQNDYDYEALSIHYNLEKMALAAFTDAEAYKYINKHIENANKKDSTQLSNLFSNIPLGLSQSVAYIKTNRCKIEDYIKKHQGEKNNHQQLTSLLDIKSDPHISDIYITLSMSVDKISEVEPKAFDLLKIFSYLNSEKIPDYLFETMFEDNIEKSKILAVLEGYSLISLKEVKGVKYIYLHQILQETIRFKINNKEEIIKNVIDLVLKQLQPSMDIAIIVQKRQALLPHSISLIKHYEQVDHKNDDLNKLALKLYNERGNIYLSLLKLDMAEENYKKALEIVNQIYKENSEKSDKVLAISCNIAAISLAAKKYQEAIEQYENVLLIYKNRVDHDYHKSTNIICKIAYSYLMLKKNQLALEKYEVALENSKNDNDSGDVADIKYAIASVYLATGKYKEAIERYDEVLKVYKKLSSEHSPNVAKVINSIGNAYRIAGEYENAIEQYNLAIDIYKELYNQPHLNVAINMREIGKVYYAKKEYEPALTEYVKVLEMFQSSLNDEHFMLGKIFYEIGKIYKAQDQHTEALEYFNKALIIHQDTYGIDDKKTLEISQNINLMITTTEIKSVIKRQDSKGSKNLSQSQEEYSLAFQLEEFMEHIEYSQKSCQNSQESNENDLGIFVFDPKNAFPEKKNIETGNMLSNNNQVQTRSKTKNHKPKEQVTVNYVNNIKYTNELLNHPELMKEIYELGGRDSLNALITISNDKDIALNIIEVVQDPNYGSGYLLDLFFSPLTYNNARILDIKLDKQEHPKTIPQIPFENEEKKTQIKQNDYTAHLYSFNVGFKALDTAADLTRMIYEPTRDNAHKLIVNSNYLYGMVNGINAYSAVISSIEVATKMYHGEYYKAGQLAANTLAFMILPSIIESTNLPYANLVYQVALTVYNGYGTGMNVYLVYVDVTKEDAKERSATYQDLAQVLSKTFLQNFYDFESLQDHHDGYIVGERIAVNRGFVEDI